MEYYKRRKKENGCVNGGNNNAADDVRGIPRYADAASQFVEHTEACVQIGRKNIFIKMSVSDWDEIFEGLNADVDAECEADCSGICPSNGGHEESE